MHFARKEFIKSGENLGRAFKNVVRTGHGNQEKDIEKKFH